MPTQHHLCCPVGVGEGRDVLRGTTTPHAHPQHTDPQPWPQHILEKCTCPEQSLHHPHLDRTGISLTRCFRSRGIFCAHFESA